MHYLSKEYTFDYLSVTFSGTCPVDCQVDISRFKFLNKSPKLVKIKMNFQSLTNNLNFFKQIRVCSKSTSVFDEEQFD